MEKGKQLPGRSNEALLRACEAELARARAGLPAGASIEALLSHVRAALARRPDLAQCTPASVVRAAVDAAFLGLPIETGGLAYLVPYTDRNGVRHAQLIVGYRGYLALLREHPEVASVGAQVVRERDYVEIFLGNAPSIVHKPAIVNRGDIVGAYAFVETKSGGRIVEWMGIEDIRAVADRALRRQSSSPWRTDFDEMARKTVLRRLTKWAPSYDRLLRALDVDEVPPDESEGVAGGHVGQRRVVRSSVEALTAAVAATVGGGAIEESGAAEAPAIEPPAEEQSAQVQPPKRRAVHVVLPSGEVWSSCSDPVAWWDSYRQLVALSKPEDRRALAAANAAALKRVAAHIGDAEEELRFLDGDASGEKKE